MSLIVHHFIKASPNLCLLTTLCLILLNLDLRTEVLKLSFFRQKIDEISHLTKHHIQQIKMKLRSFKSVEHINEKADGPYRGFGYLSLSSDPIDLAT